MGETAGPDRFELKEQIGAGSMGSVYRVHDRMRGRDVALKTLRASGPNALYRFKREFRELCELCHPNLVALHELYVVGDEWMFTMELVEGVRFKDWVRGSPERLRDATIQLADGLTALHATGNVHRDIKPSNVLVAPDGRVVILDFGLVSDPTKEEQTHDRMAIGTPGYMSPEQAADVPVSSATDWYAAGAMLYESLTGWKPFAGPSYAVLLDKQRFDPPPPSSVADNVPADLETLTMALLARDPRARPDGPAVLAALGAAPSPWTERIAQRAARAALGATRTTEIAALHDALRDSRDRPVIALIDGRRGVGRSALLDAFADQLEVAGDPVVFHVRIGRREDVPFRGLDQLVDHITRYLLNAPEEEVAEVLPGDLESLARMFPTLQRLRAARLPEPSGRPPDRVALGQRAFAAVAETLAAIATRRPLTVLLDDIHFGNLIGAEATLRMLSHARAPHILVVATYPTEDSASPIVHALAGFTGELRRLTLT